LDVEIIYIPAGSRTKHTFHRYDTKDNPEATL
jgi:hypothetical protein